MRIIRNKSYDANIVGNRLSIVDRSTGAELFSVDVPNSMDFVDALAQVVECLKTALGKNIVVKREPSETKAATATATAKKKTTTKKTAKNDENN